MGRAYYYFAASLPTLMREGKAPLSLESFLDQCRTFLHPSDFFLMEKLLTGEIDPDSEINSGTVLAWKEFDRSLRNEMVSLRAERMKKDPSAYWRGQRAPDFYLKRLAEEASKEENILSAEQMVDKVRWEVLDDLEKGHFFDFDYLILYGLKLKILLRRQTYSSPKGKEILEGYKLIKGVIS